MPIKDPRFPGAVLVTLLIAIALTVLPLDDQLDLWRPEWIVLTLAHWAVVIKDRLSLLLAFLVGLLIDTMFGSLMGQHALGYLLVSYFSVLLALRMTAESFFQQLSMLIVTLGIYMVVNFLEQRVTHSGANGWMYWAPLASSLIVWPIYHALLGYFHVQRKML